MATMICFPPILPVRRTLLTYVSEGCNSAVTDWNCESVTVGNLSWADCLCIVWRTGSNGLSLPTEPAVVQLQHCQCSSALAVSLNGSSDCPQQLDFSLQQAGIETVFLDLRCVLTTYNDNLTASLWRYG